MVTQICEEIAMEKRLRKCHHEGTVAKSLRQETLKRKVWAKNCQKK